MATFHQYNSSSVRPGDGGGISPIDGVKIPATYSETMDQFEEAVLQNDTVYASFALHLDAVPREEAEIMLKIRSASTRGWP